jgi:hypothetical protein
MEQTKGIDNRDSSLHDEKVLAPSRTSKLETKLLCLYVAPTALKVAQHVITRRPVRVTSNPAPQWGTDCQVVQQYRLVADAAAKITCEPAGFRADRDLVDDWIEDEAGHCVGTLLQDATERFVR